MRENIKRRGLIRKLLTVGTIKTIAGKVWDVASYGLMLAASYKLADYVAGGDGSKLATYDDAVKAIMDSSMFSHDKADAVAVLSRYESSTFYKAIVHVAKDSSMFSHDKVEMIKTLSEK